MFVIEVLESIGKPPIRLVASQAVIRLPDGTPISIAAMFGGPNGVLVSHCEDASFNSNLHKLGINETVISSSLKV